MARIDVTLQGRRIPVACADGQEERVREVAAYVDRRMGHLRQTLRGPSDIELLALTSIAMGDDLLSLQDGQTTGQAEAQGDAESPAQAGPETAESGAAASDDQAALAHILETLAGRIEAVAARLEGP